jgi:hypothetical protein
MWLAKNTRTGTIKHTPTSYLTMVAKSDDNQKASIRTYLHPAASTAFTTNKTRLRPGFVSNNDRFVPFGLVDFRKHYI